MDLEIVNLILDFILIGAAVWMIFVIRGMGGVVGKAFGIMAWGAILLGIAHLLETVMFELFHGEEALLAPDAMDEELIEVIHRLIVLPGMVLLVLGFKKISSVK